MYSIVINEKNLSTFIDAVNFMMLLIVLIDVDRFIAIMIQVERLLSNYSLLTPDLVKFWGI